MDDRAVVAAQIGRPPRSAGEVVARCQFGLPVVTRVPPVLDDGTPFPTLYWLTCPLAVRRASRLESAGGVARAEELVAADEEIGVRHRSAAERYAVERRALLPPDHIGPVPTGGVGGTERGVKCLHAHYADHAAGNDNPIGEWVALAVEPLDDAMPCVVEIDGAVVRNPEWREPMR